MRVIVITQPSDIEGEGELISAILTTGVNRIHIRKPNWSSEKTAQLINQIPHNLRYQLTLHDHFELCKELGVGGIQLNGRNPIAPQGFKGLVSRSCHTISELEQECDYATLSPIYDSISKCGYKSSFAAEELQAIKPNTIALGGVTPQNIPTLHALGFEGVAILGYMWQEPTIEGVTLRAKRAVKVAKMCKNFSLQFITHRNDTKNDTQGAAAAIEGGCRWVQLRMKGFEDEQFIESAATLREMCNSAGATFLLNDRVDLVKECRADGVHIGKGDMPPSEARAILGEGAIIGGTANTCDDIDCLISQGIDYIGLGPFRFTTTKEKLSPTLGLDGYKQAIEHCRTKGYTTPIVAIGGITVGDIPSIMECGVSGIALSGTILNAEDSVAVTSDIVKILRR
ncbi:MAG: thiamine phosphate synthase [Rikenellaceae bacterium]